MNCTYHIQDAITLICTAPHKCKCQRKLCTQCQYEHGVDLKYTVPIKIFREKVIQKLKEQKLDQTSELTKQRISFKSLLFQTESMLKKIWEDLSNSIQQIYIEMEDKSYLKIINDNLNPAELSNTDLEKLVQIMEGQQLNDWDVQKNSYLQKLEQTKNCLDQEIQAFGQKLMKEMKEIQTLIKVHKQEVNVNESKEELFEIYSSIKDLDVKIFSAIIEIMKKEKISDIQGFLQRDDTHKHFNLKNKEKQNIIKVIRNINEHDFNRNDYSSDIYLKSKEDLTKRIRDDKNIIELLKFLVNLTAIDCKFIQCGSNSLCLLVEIKVDLKNHNFENIRIKNTSLVGANFVRCNLSGSQFENVDISGMNLNGAILFNCQWKNIKIQGQLNKLDSHNDCVNFVCFSPDGTTLASGGDKSVRLWNVKTGQQIAKLDGHTGVVNSVCFSPYGTTLASGSNDQSIRLWDLKTKKKKAKLDGHSSKVISVCFSSDGTTLASYSYDQTIRIWNAKTGQQRSKSDYGCQYQVISIFISSDGTVLACGRDSGDPQFGKGHNSICIWDVIKEEEKAIFYGPANSVRSVCFSSDGAILASCTSDSIRLWDVKTGYQKSKLDGHSVQIVCFSPDGTTLASSSEDNSICLWDVETGQQKSQLDCQSEIILSLCFSPDGTSLASGSYDKSISLWDVKTVQQKYKLDGHKYSVNSVCFSPDGTILASGSSKRWLSGGDFLCLWDVKTGQQKSKLHDHQQSVHSVCFSPDGNTLASGSKDNSIRLWDVRTEKEIQSTDKRYKDILAQYKTSLFQNNPLPEIVNTNITILLISQTPIFQAQRALVFQGEFVNYQGVDFLSLLKSRGSCILENQLELKSK